MTHVLSMQVCTPPSDTESDSDTWGTWRGTEELHAAKGTAVDTKTTGLDAACQWGDWKGAAVEPMGEMADPADSVMYWSQCYYTP